MRRFLGLVLLAFFGLPLLAATPQSELMAKPNVIVYPFVPTGASIDREAGSRLATILAQQMAETGRVKVIPPPPGTDRADYLKVALANNADYYVTGYITPLGDAVAVVEQVVSTTTGIVVFSQTAQIKTYSDAAGQGADLGNAIAGHANRNYAAIGTAPPQSSPTPAPSSGPQANLTNLLGRKKKNAATPAPKPAVKPTPVASAPAAALTNVTTPPSAAPTAAPTATTAPSLSAPKTVAEAAVRTADFVVVPIGGSAAPALRERATQRLVDRVHGELAGDVRAICAAHKVRAILSGGLTVRPAAQSGGSATLALTASSCSGTTLWHQTHVSLGGGAEGQQVAVDGAVDAALSAYLKPLK